MKLLCLLLTISILLSGSLCAGSALAQSEKSKSEAGSQDRVLILMVYDDDCKKYCSQVRPILTDLKGLYGERVILRQLNVTQAVLDKTYEEAKELGVGTFLKGVLDYVPCVGVFTRKRKLVKELPGVKKKDVYARYIDKALESN